MLVWVCFALEFRRNWADWRSVDALYQAGWHHVLPPRPARRYCGRVTKAVQRGGQPHRPPPSRNHSSLISSRFYSIFSKYLFGNIFYRSVAVISHGGKLFIDLMIKHSFPCYLCFKVLNDSECVKNFAEDKNLFMNGRMDVRHYTLVPRTLPLHHKRCELSFRPRCWRRYSAGGCLPAVVCGCTRLPGYSASFSPL